MNAARRAAAGIVIMIVTAFLLAFSSYWYLEVIPAVIVGFYVTPTRLLSLVSGIGAIAGTLVYIITVPGISGLNQGGIVSGIIGIPGGYTVLLVITLLILFGIAFMGSLLGSSFSVKKEAPKSGN